MSKLSVVAKVELLPGTREEMITLFSQFASYVQENEPGLEVYTLHVSDLEPNVCWVFELYASSDAFDIHQASPEMARLRPMLSQLWAEPPDVHRLVPAAGVGIAFT